MQTSDWVDYVCDAQHFTDYSSSEWPLQYKWTSGSCSWTTAWQEKKSWTCSLTQHTLLQISKLYCWVWTITGEEDRDTLFKKKQLTVGLLTWTQSRKQNREHQFSGERNAGLSLSPPMLFFPLYSLGLKLLYCTCLPDFCISAGLENWIIGGFWSEIKESIILREILVQLLHILHMGTVIMTFYLAD